MLVEVKKNFISKEGHYFKRKYVFNALFDGCVYRLQAKYKRSVSYLPVTEAEFVNYFTVIDDKELADVYVA